MSGYKPNESVLYEKQVSADRFSYLPAKILNETPTGRFRIELENGARVTVAWYSLRRPLPHCDTCACQQP